ncbi:MarR family protein [Saccharopolyspora antimicrobica]|uniref:MarR family protein n=1 Tax=Saccharopolyspora antimicrobica TaxID=455193 RepID=A0A1I4TE86_9PSEU|nr:MarR family transcriptional regulator [Saccharopolyspora antimicrobica]RKT85756.1 MarR family protein [Saccharopolyspora antimicrobica]SFM74887.1 MarR family protein [Saccharopolyspora antimicrobica]
MPGGRLTELDRQRIAAGLAERLGYAEIARQLGRPTSTISREVARNGGPAGYRADYAHLATEHRARRRKSAQAPHGPGEAVAHGRDPEAVHGFVEQFAALMVRSGLPRMVARVLACLVTTDSGALTSAELVQRLRVSPASVSKAIGYLEGLEVIRRERDARARRERYSIDDDVWHRTWLVSTRKQASWAETAARGAEVFGAGTPAGARLTSMGSFFARVRDSMAGDRADAAIGDARTVLAALVHAGEPLTADELAEVLDWPLDRVSAALRAAEQRPEISDPVVLRNAGSGAYTVATRSDRLTAAQREAIRRLGLGRHRPPGTANR